MKFSPYFLIPPFSCFCVANACVVTVSNSKRSVTEIEADLSALNSNLTLYDADLHTFFQESENIALGAELHEIANASLNAFNVTTLDIIATGPLSSAGATAIEQTVEGIALTLVDICQTILDNLDSANSGSVINAHEPPTTTPVGGPVPPTLPVGSAGSGESTPLSDLTDLRNAFINLLDLLGGTGEAPASVSTQFARVAALFISQCGVVPCIGCLM